MIKYITKRLDFAMTHWLVNDFEFNGCTVLSVKVVSVDTNGDGCEVEFCVKVRKPREKK